MFEVWNLKKRGCYLLQKYLNVVTDGCETYTIWSICPHKLINQFIDMLMGCRLCKVEWFPLIFWTVMLMSLGGLAFSLVEFLRMIEAKGCVTFFRRRSFKIISCRAVRSGRIVASMIMVFAWFLVFAGAVFMIPCLMLPLICIKGTTLTADIIVYLIEVVLCGDQLEANTLLSYLMSFTLLSFVHCCHSVFQSSNNARDLLNVLKIF